MLRKSISIFLENIEFLKNLKFEKLKDENEIKIQLILIYKSIMTDLFTRQDYCQNRKDK